MCLFVLFNFSIPFFFVFPLFYTWSVVLKIYKGQISPNTHNDCFEVETNSLMYRKIVFRLWIFIYVNGLNGLLNHQLHQNYGFVTFNSNNNNKKNSHYSFDKSKHCWFAFFLLSSFSSFNYYRKENVVAESQYEDRYYQTLFGHTHTHTHMHTLRLISQNIKCIFVLNSFYLMDCGTTEQKHWRFFVKQNWNCTASTDFLFLFQSSFLIIHLHINMFWMYLN